MNEMMVLFPVRTAGQKKEMVRDCKSLYSRRPDCKSARTDDKFRKVGIEPNNYGAWWATDAHRSNSSAYNKAWGEFFYKHRMGGYTAEDCHRFAIKLKELFKY